MKKIIALFLVFTVCLGLCACGGSGTPEAKTIVEAEPPTETASEKKDEYIVYSFEGESTQLVTIEEIVIKPYTITSADNASFFLWTMKVRNTSGEDIPAESNIQIFYNYLDENMDLLDSRFVHPIRHAVLKDGRAEKIEENSRPGNWTKSELEEVAYIEIYGYQVGSLRMEPEFELDEPILINVKEYVSNRES